MFRQLQAPGFKRYLSVLLALSMICGTIPVYAADSDYPLKLTASEDTYCVGEQADVQVAAPDGAALFFTLDGTDPSEDSERVQNLTIPVTSDDPTVINVKVLAVVTEGNSLAEAKPETTQQTGIVDDIVPGNEYDEIADDNTVVSVGDNAALNDGANAVEEDDADTDASDEDDAITNEEDNTAESSNNDVDVSDEDDAITNEEDNTAESSNNDVDVSDEDDISVNDDDNVAAIEDNTIAKDEDNAIVPDEGTFFDDDNGEFQSLVFNDSLDTDDSADKEGIKTNNENVKKTEYRASLEIEFVEPAVPILSRMARSIGPTLNTENNKIVYTLNDTAEINVDANDSTVYYSILGTPSLDENGDPNEGTYPVGSSNTISITAPNANDGGTITVTAAYATENENGVKTLDTTTSAMTLSFYRAEQDSSDEMLLTTNEGSFYFSAVSNAFDALKDTNLTGNATLKLLKNATYTISSANASGTYAFFGSITLKITGVILDLAGNQLTLKNTSSYDGQIRLFYSNRLPKMQITDTTVQNTPAVVDGSKNEATNSYGSIVCNGVFWNLAVPTVEIDHIRVMTTGSSATEGMRIGTNTTVAKVENVVADGSFSIGTLHFNLAAGGDCQIKNSVISNSNSNGAGISCGINTFSIATTGCLIDSSCKAISLGTQSSLAVYGGIYVGSKAAIEVMEARSATLYSGVFDGAFTGSGTVKIAGSDCYHKGEWTAQKDITGYNEVHLEDGTYSGYTQYVQKEKLTGTVSIIDKDNADLSYVAVVSATDIDGNTVDNFSAYDGSEIIWTVSCRADYKLTGKVLYQEGGNDPETVSESDYTLKDGILTYKKVVPETNYKLTFEVEYIGSTEGYVAQIGTTQYHSLTTAMANLAANETLTLIADSTYSEALEFNKENVALDLNGKTLTMDVEPQSNMLASAHSILVSGDTLTIKDGSDSGTGTLSFNERDLSGILVDGTDTTLNLESGTLTGLTALGGAYSVVCTAENGEINFSGGLIEGRILMRSPTAVLNISENAQLKTVGVGQALSVFYGNVKMTGGTIDATEESCVGTEVAAVYLILGGFKMTGGKLTSNLESPAIYMGESGEKKVEISGSAEIVAKNNAAIQVLGSNSTENCNNLTIAGQAKLKGDTNSISIEDIAYLPAITITGGYFACGSEYLPISDTSFVTFPDEDSDGTPDLVLDVNKSITEGYEDYYGLIDPDDLGGTYIPEEGGSAQAQEYTYQDYFGFSDGSNSGLYHMLADGSEKDYAESDFHKAYVAGRGSLAQEVWDAFVTAYDLAVRCLTNKNANQMEIDYRAAQLTASYLAMDSVSGLDLSKLKDGRYSAQIGLWKSNMTTPSMANGAADPTAILVKRGNAWELELTFGPTYQYMVYGHLEDFYIYHGTNLTTSKANMQSDHDGASTTLKDEAEYLNWYKGSSTTATQEFCPCKTDDADCMCSLDGGTAPGANCSCGKNGTYNLPGNVRVTLPYVGLDSDTNSYWVGMNVDAMGGYATAILRISWSTLTEIEAKDTLTLDNTSMTLNIADVDKTSATATATILGDDGYTLSYAVNDAGKDKVDVSIDGYNVTVTGKAVGSAVVTVTASKDGVDLTPVDISVLIANGTEASATTTVTGSTAETTVSGAALMNTGNVTIADGTITINATANESTAQIQQAQVTMTGEFATALNQTLTALGITSAVIETDVADIALDAATVQQAAALSGGTKDVKLVITETSVTSDVESPLLTIDVTLYVDGTAVKTLNGTISINVETGAGDNEIVYAYYIVDGKIQERVTTATKNGVSTWNTNHCSTWVLSKTYHNTEEEGGTIVKPEIPEDIYGTWSVPVYVRNVSTGGSSMANGAVASYVKAKVTEDDVTYTLAFQGMELQGLYGHLLNLWYYTNYPDDMAEASYTTYSDKGLDGEIETFPRTATFTIDGERTDSVYVMVNVDAMNDPTINAGKQDAQLVFSWNKAEKDSGDLYESAFGKLSSGTTTVIETESVVNSGSSISSTKLEDYIDEGGLTVQNEDQDLSAVLDTAALEAIAKEAGTSSVKITIEEATKSKLATAQKDAVGDRPIYNLTVTIVSSDKTITSFGSGVVTVKFPYTLKTGEDADGLVIWLVADDGTVKEIDCTYNSNSKTVTFKTSDAGVFAIGYDEARLWTSPFTDVTKGDWYYDAVRYVVQKGLFNGTSATTFSPNVNMSRAMLVTVLYRLEGEPEVTEAVSFTDIPADIYYANAVAWANANGIVTGYENGLFSPNNSITREQMAVILYRYAAYKEYDVSATASLEGYTDLDTVGSFAEDAMKWAVGAGLITGTSETTLAPKNTATRAQVATILMRFAKNIAK